MLTDEKHLATVKRIREGLKANIVDLKAISDDIAEDDAIDDDVKEGISETVADIEEIEADLGGYTGETTPEE
jgi:hypothetical protein